MGAGKTGHCPGFAADGRAMRGVLAAALLAVAAGCTTVATQAPAPPPMAAGPMGGTNIAITVADLQGNWGLASFRNEADAVRTEEQARIACNNPYKVAPGPTGGAMMYLADQAQPTEVFVKPGAGGQVFIGPQGPPQIAQDRVVISYQNNVLITDWLDASARERYGTMIFVRCGVA